MPDRSDLHWFTGITDVRPNELRLRGYRIDALMGRVTFAEAIYLALVGELPSLEVGRLVDAILVASVDHGATPPSTLAARTAASTGAPLNAALAAGLLSINRHHGGAVEGCMRLIMQVVDSAADGDLAGTASTLVAAQRAEGKRMPGFGHRLHSADPRVARLFALAEEARIAGRGVAVVQLLAEALAAQSGRALPINVDGALAAILFDLGLAPELANAFFMLARVPGLVAHIREEQTRERPVRPIHPTDHEYDGPVRDDDAPPTR
jgi:citrate synthase